MSWRGKGEERESRERLFCRWLTGEGRKGAASREGEGSQRKKGAEICPPAVKKKLIYQLLTEGGERKEKGEVGGKRGGSGITSPISKKKGGKIPRFLEQEG